MVKIRKKKLQSEYCLNHKYKQLMLDLNKRNPFKANPGGRAVEGVGLRLVA